MNRTQSRTRFPRIVVAMALLAASLAWVVGVDKQPAIAGPPPVLTAYVPLPANDYQAALATIGPAAGTLMQERIGITVAAANSIVYYDHWEDGYEADIANPTPGGTTEVWGDGNTANGDAGTHCVSGCSGDVFAAGAVLSFSNSIPTPRTTAIRFDGGDKIASTRGFTVTKAGWGESGPLHAGAVAAFDTSKFGTYFRIPVGENTVAGQGSDDPFNYTGVSVMAQRDGTVVQIDADANGSYEQAFTINQGQTAFVNGGVLQGARVVSTKPVQAHLMTGDRTATYEDRWFELFPETIWDSSYFAAAVVNDTDQRTELWVYNQQEVSTTVSVLGPSGTLATLNIAANGVARYLPPLNTAVELRSTSPFYALGAIGTASPANSSRSDWGYTLVPTSVLTPSLVIGWAPGNGDQPPTANDSAVYVAATGATTIYVDYNGDGTADTSFTSAAYASTPVVDPNDHDMTGARIYTLDGTPITAAFGQNPAVAPPGNPALDLGITVVPATAIVVTKDVALSNDITGDGFVNPGDTLRWDITVSDAGSLSLTNAVVSDTVPVNTTYVPGSTRADFGAGMVALPDDVPPASSPFPLDESGYNLGTVAPGSTYTVTFETIVDNPFTAGTDRLTNVARVVSDQASSVAAASTPVFVPELAITKSSSTGGVPLGPGDTYSYTIDVTNTGNIINSNVVIVDQLPAGVTWISTEVTAPQTTASRTWGDTFQSSTWTGGTGTWAGNWTEINDNGNAGSGDVLIGSDAGSLRMHLQNNSKGALRRIGDLSSYEYVDVSFDYRRDSLDSETEWLQMDISPDNGTASTGTWNPSVRIPGPATDPAYLSEIQAITPLVNPASGGTSVLRFLTSPSMTQNDDLWIDNLVVRALDRSPATFPGVEPVALTGYALTSPFDLAPGEVASITVTVRVNDPLVPFSDTLVNTATVTSDRQPYPSGAQVTDSVELIDLSLSKTETSAAAVAGQDSTFRITVSNAGPSDATGVEVSDHLPVGMTFISAVTSQGSYDEVSGIWVVGDVANSASATLDVTATVLSADPMINTAQVSAADQTDADSAPANDLAAEDDQASVTVDVVEGADLEVTKVETASPSYVGQVASFEIAVTNQGPYAADSVVVHDQLPPGLTYSSDTPSQGTFVPGTGMWDVGSLAVGASATLTITANVGTVGTSTNVAQVVASSVADPDSTPNNSAPAEDDQDEASVTVATLVDLSLSKTVDIAAPRIGDTVTFTIVVDNDGPSPATTVEVTDLLPIGLAYSSSTPSQGSYDDVSGVWTVGTIAASGSATLLVAATPTGDGTFTNIAEVTSADEPDVDSTPDNAIDTEDDQDSAVVTVEPEADLSLTKTETASPSYLGDLAVFEVTLTNEGPNTATGVEVSDVLPAGLSFVSATATQGSYDQGTAVWTVGSVASGVSVTLTMTVTVDTVAPVVNTAEVSLSDQYDPDSTPNNDIPTEDDQASVVVDVEPLVDVSLSKSVSDGGPLLGDVVTFTVSVSNAGPSVASGVEVVDVLPGGLGFVSSSVSQGVFSPVSGVWTVGAVAVGGTATLTIDALVVGSVGGTNTAEVTAVVQDDVDSTPGNGVGSEDDQDSASWDPVAVDVSLSKVVDVSFPLRGSDVTYTLTVANTGPDTATGVEVADVLPAGLTFVSSSASQGAYVAGTGVWDVGSLVSGGSATLAITVTVDRDTPVSNVAEVVGVDQPDVDSTPGNGVGSEDDQDDAPIAPTAVADVSLTKTETAGPVHVGDGATFVVTVVNGGPSVATNVAVVDVVPAGLTFVSATPSQGTYDEATGLWSVGTVPVGGSATVSIDVTVDTDGAVVNTAQVTASDQFDPDSIPGNGVVSEDDQDSASVDVVPLVDLSVDKAVTGPATFVGDTATFTVTVANAGPSTATGVEVTDQLPAGLTFVSATVSQGTYVAGTGLWTVGTLASTGSATLTIDAVVTAASPIVNTAQVTAQDQDDIDSTPNNDIPTEDDHDTATITVAPLVDLSLTKTETSTPVHVGDTATFTVTVTNDGPSTATGVEVTDLLPAGLTYASDSTSQGIYVPGTGVWNVGTLTNGATATLTITATVTTPNTITNTAQITAQDQNDTDSTPNNDVPTEDDQASVAISTTPIIDLSLAKSASASTVTVGADVVFTLTVTNAGPSPATGVHVTDVLPAGLTYVSATASQGSYDDASGVWTVGSIANGDSETLTLTATVVAAGSVTNTTEVTAANELDVDSTPNNGDPAEDDQATASVTGILVDLEVFKTVDVPNQLVGSDVVFTVTVTNTGLSTGTGITVTDLLPAGLTYGSSTISQGTYDETTGLWDVGALAPSQIETLSVTATVATAGDKTNSAEVTAQDQPDRDSTPANNDPLEDDQASVTVSPTPNTDISLTKTVDETAPRRGSDVTFTIEVTNDGPNAASGLAVTDVLPAGLSFVSYTATQGTFDDGSGVWTIGGLASGSTVSMDLTATVDVDGTVVNVAQVSTLDQLDPDSTPGNGVPTEDDQDSVSLAVVAVADLSLSKAVDTATPQIGDTVTFTITISNGGPSTATSVEVTDLLPTGLTYLSDNASTGVYDDATGVWAIGSLTVGQTETLEISGTVDTDAVVVNSAEVTAVTEIDPDSTPANDDPLEDDQDTASLSPTPLADLELAKVVDDATPTVGSDVTFTITLTNSGPSDATGIVVTDLLPSGLVFVSATPSQGTYDQPTGLWTVGGVTVGGNAELLIVATVTNSTTIVNSAEVAAVNELDPDSTPGNGEPTEDDIATALVSGQMIDLELTNTVDVAEVGPGDDATFTVTIVNRGQAVATGVTVSDVLPSGVTYASDTSGGSFDSLTGVWDVGSLSPGGSASFTVTVTVDTLGPHTATAQVRSADQPDVDSTPANDEPAEDDQADATVTARLVDLEVTKSVADNQIGLGAQTAFTITVTNQGPDTATGVALAEVLPAGLTYLSATPSQGTYNYLTGMWSVGAMALGQTETLNVTVAGAAVGVFTNTVEVTASDQTDVDSTPANGVPTEDDHASSTVEVVAIDLAVSKSVDEPAPNVGGVVVFTITVGNSGPSTATGVSVADVLPTDLGFVSSVATQGTFDSVTGRWTVGTLAAGQEEILTITTTANTADPVVNVAQVVTADQVDIDSTPGNGVASEDDQASATVDPVAARLSGLVWIDANTNGLFDPGELPASGVVVTLVDGSGVEVAQMTTGVTGTFDFDDLAPGLYTVVLGSLPDGVELGTADPDGTIDGRYELTLNDGDNVSDIDFGLRPAGTSVTTTTTATTTTTTPSTGDLPKTGADVDRLVVVAIQLILGGIALVLMTGRRRRRGHRDA